MKTPAPKKSSKTNTSPPIEGEVWRGKGAATSPSPKPAKPYPGRPIDPQWTPLPTGGKKS